MSKITKDETLKVAKKYLIFWYNHVLHKPFLRWDYDNEHIKGFRELKRFDSDFPERSAYENLWFKKMKV